MSKRKKTTVESAEKPALGLNPHPPRKPGKRVAKEKAVTADTAASSKKPSSAKAKRTKARPPAGGSGKRGAYSGSFVSRYERGKHRLDLIEFCHVTRALGLDPVRVLGDLIKAGL